MAYHDGYEGGYGAASPQGFAVAVLVETSSVAVLGDAGFAQAVTVPSESETVLVGASAEADVADPGFATAPVDQSKSTV